MKTRLEEHYLTAVRPALIEKFGYANVMQAPKLKKIVINMGVGEAVRDSKKVEHASRELAAISGQKPIITRSKKANSREVNLTVEDHKVPHKRLYHLVING